MIRVLQNWEEIGQATIELQRRGLPLHSVPQKNWDLWHIYQSFRDLTDKRVVDLGCGGLHVLNLLNAMGFTKLFGVDVTFSLGEYIIPYYVAFRSRNKKLPHKLIRGNIERMRFKDDTFEAAICLSVLEHGVSLTCFFEEVSRILMNGARLYISVDYWEPKIPTVGISMYGRPYTVFCKEEVINMIQTARKYGFNLKQNMEIPEVCKPIIYFRDKAYTFLSIEFVLKK